MIPGGKKFKNEFFSKVSNSIRLIYRGDQKLIQIYQHLSNISWTKRFVTTVIKSKFAILDEFVTASFLGIAREMICLVI